jgi:hypothetical protein
MNERATKQHDWDHFIESEIRSSLDKAPLSQKITLEIDTNAA